MKRRPPRPGAAPSPRATSSRATSSRVAKADRQSPARGRPSNVRKTEGHGRVGRVGRGEAVEGVDNLLLGAHAVEEALRVGEPLLSLIFDGHARGRLQPVLEAATRAGVVLHERDAEALNRMTGGLRHQGIVAHVPPFHYLDLRELVEQGVEGPRTVVHQPAHHVPDEDATPGALASKLGLGSAGQVFLALDQVTDPHNFGAMIRSAVALGASGLITTKRRACKVNATVRRTSAGATAHARIAEVSNLAESLRWLSSEGFCCVGLSSEGEEVVGPMHVYASPGRARGVVLVVGAEGEGLRRLTQERCDVLARIPLGGRFDSLNASVAAAIAMDRVLAARVA